MVCKAYAAMQLSTWHFANNFHWIGIVLALAGQLCAQAERVMLLITQTTEGLDYRASPHANSSTF